MTAKPQKLGDKTHIDTIIASVGQFMNPANAMLGAFCKYNPKEDVGIFCDKSRISAHEYSKDLLTHLSFKDEDATGKGIFAAPKKGHFYRIENDVIQFDPENKKVILQDKTFTYNNLIVAGENLFDWARVTGMQEAVQDFWNSKVTSTAQVKFANMAWRSSIDFRGGNFVYALPKSPYKNEGTSHIFMLFDEFEKDRKVEGLWYGSKFIVTTPDEFIHRVPWVNKQLVELAEKKGIEIRYNLQLKEIRYSQIRNHHRVSEFVYENTKTGGSEVLDYGSAYCYPESKAPEIIKPFADSTGLMEVDHHTLVSKKYPDVFGIGEIINVPTISNSIATLGQAQVVAGNLADAIKGMAPHASYNGTSATPIFTGWHKLIMPGFAYGWEEVNTRLATDTSSPLASLKQTLSFAAFKRFEKKWFDKKHMGKIYGPPNWTKPDKKAAAHH
jgi:sulfide:quinone oxidoreductase